METKTINTEDKILDAAVEVFLDKGYTGARMQQIADRAEINKALLHYYYRNKEKLFVKAFEKLLTIFLEGILGKMSAKQDLDSTISEGATEQLKFLRKHKKLPLFILNAFQQQPKLIKEVINKVQMTLVAEMLTSAIAQEKNISKEEAKLWFVSFMSTRIFPIVASELYKTIFIMDDQEYDQFLDKQKDFSLALFINNHKN